MKKTLLHRLFGWGKLPKQYRLVLESEGIKLLDEGIGGSITYKQFKAPGRRYSWKRNAFTGCLVLTEKTFAAFAFSRPIIYVPFDHDKFSALKCSSEDGKGLLVHFDAAAFHEGWSGTIACRFKTAAAQMFLDHL